MVALRTESCRFRRALACIAPALLACLVASCAQVGSGTLGQGPGKGLSELVLSLHEPIPSADEDGGVPELIVLVPVPCDVVSVATHAPSPSCDETMLRSGRMGNIEFVAVVGFDLSDLPSSMDVRHGSLELTGIDGDFLQADGTWVVSAIDVPAGEDLQDQSFARLMGAGPFEPRVAWRLESKDLRRGRRNALPLDEAALHAIAPLIGHGRLTLRIEGPTDGGNLFAWAARGDDGPRLRLGYVAMPGPAVSAKATP